MLVFKIFLANLLCLTAKVAVEKKRGVIELFDDEINGD